MIRKWLIYCTFFLIAIQGNAQELSAEVSEETILIGQPTSIMYHIRTLRNDSIFFRPKQGTIEGKILKENSTISTEKITFEILNPFHDTTALYGNFKRWLGEYTITAWDSGRLIVPGPTVMIADSTFTFPDITLYCDLMAQKEDIALYDIKENYAELPPPPFSFSGFLKNHWWWLSLILVAIVGFFILRKKRNKEETEEAKPMSLKVRTLLAIEALDNEKMWERGRLKEHFVELSYILRAYLTSRYSVSLLEKTTHETKLILTQKGLNEDTVEIIARILSQSDMVKFAKSNPDVISIVRQSTLAKQIVAETSPLDFDNEE